MQTLTATVSNALAARIAAYADAKGLTADDAHALILDAGLRAWERARKAGVARSDARTSAEQAAAAHSRWGTTPKPAPKPKRARRKPAAA